MYVYVSPVYVSHCLTGTYLTDVIKDTKSSDISHVKHSACLTRVLYEKLNVNVAL